MSDLKETKITEYFIEDGSRYGYDNMLTASKGWAQIDDSQDAPYYGQWANPITLKYVSYVEGDFTFAQFATVGEFLEWIGNCSKMESFKGIDIGCNDKLTEAFKAIGLEKLLH